MFKTRIMPSKSGHYTAIVYRDGTPVFKQRCGDLDKARQAAAAFIATV